MSMLEAALSYIQRGWNVFPLFYVVKGGDCSCHSRNPCKRVGKHPIPRNGVQAASNSEAQIRQWWVESPHANIGLATGINGLVVVDIDSNNGKVGNESLETLEAKFGALPETLEVTTGSGGRHLYFTSQQPIPNSASKVAADIDVRGIGGYVILPPSNHASGGHYQWANGYQIAPMPAWMEALCIARRIEVADADTLQVEVLEDAKKFKERQLSKTQLVTLLNFISPDCEREVWWKVGAALKKELGEEKGFEAWDEWSRRAPDKYDAKIMPVQWRSFEDKGVSAGTIVHFAKEGGFRGFDEEAADADEFVNSWCYIASIKRFVHLDTLTEWDREQFDAMFAPLFSKGTASVHVLKNGRFKRVNSATYWPRHEAWVEEHGVSKLNYWRPNGLVAAKGDVSPFLEHVEYLYPDPDEAKILTSFLAYQVQNPGEKVHWALLLEGVQGTGKSFFANVMRKVLGSVNVHMVSNEQLHETYTGWQRNTQLVIVEELMAKGRLELMNKLKPMITEEWCSIREMYKPPYEQPNRFNFMFFSNFSNSIIIDTTDRRYCVLKSPAVPRESGYYKRLFEWTEANVSALLWYMEKYDLSGFRAKAHAPMTEAKKNLIQESMLPLDSFLYERTEAKEYPMQWDVISPSTLVEPLGKYNLRTTPKDVAVALGRLGYLNLGRCKSNEGQKLTFWAIRNFDEYREMSSDQLRMVWAMQVNGEKGRLEEDRIAEALVAGKGINPLVGQEPM